MPASTSNYQQLFLDDVPLLDVRSPVEFIQGAFPNSVNIPLLTDHQRELIGTRYKEAGQDAAIALGLSLATPVEKTQRIQDWSEFCQQFPQGYLYCFRGGLRSRTTRQWLHKAGLDYPLVTGGYKAMRSFLLAQLASHSTQQSLILLSGATGTGKTRLLNSLTHTIDLEGLAKHRGSAFGHMLTAQPSQINFENQLAIQLLKHHAGPGYKTPLVLEDEGRLIGRISLPEALKEAMGRADLVVLESSMEERLQLIRQGYIEMPWKSYQLKYKALAQEHFTTEVLGNLYRIRKRLGGVRYEKVRLIFTEALDKLFLTGDSAAFNEGIQILLCEYYDPMYNYLLDKREGKILFRGNQEAISEWAEKSHFTQ